MIMPRNGFSQKEYFKEWYLNNKPKMKAYMIKYRKEHPEYVERELAKRRKPNGYIARRKPKRQKRKVIAKLSRMASAVRYREKNREKLQKCQREWRRKKVKEAEKKNE